MQDQDQSGVSDPLLSPEEKERSTFEGIYRKLCWNLAPWLFLVTLVCYMDRTNLSLAAKGMEKDIGLTKVQYGLAASLFFVTYLPLQIPSNYVLARVGAPVSMGVRLVGWGLTASMTAFVQKSWQLYVLRLVLGALEAGTFPGLNYYASLFIPENYQAHFLSFMYAGLFVGLWIMGPVGAGLLSMHGVLSVSGWRWLLFLEGLPACILGIALAWLLPKNPSAARFLSEEEKEVLRGELEQDPESENIGFWISLKRTLLNGPLAILTLARFLYATGHYSAFFWTPLWIDSLASGHPLEMSSSGAGEHGRSEVKVALLSTIPYAFSAASGIAVGRSSTYFRDRKIHIVVVVFLAGVSFCFLPIASKQGLVVSMIVLTITHIACGSLGSTMTWLVISVLSKNLAAFGLAWYNSVFNLCGVIGPSMIGFLAAATGSYVSSFYVSGSLCFLASILFGLVNDSLHAKKRQNEVGSQP